MKTPAMIQKNVQIVFIMSSLFLASIALADTPISTPQTDNSDTPFTVKKNCGADNGGGANNGGGSSSSGGGTGTGAGNGTGATGTGATGTGSSGAGTISTNAAGCLSGTAASGQKLCVGTNLSGMEWGGNTDPFDNIVQQPANNVPVPNMGVTTSGNGDSFTTSIPFFASKGMTIIRLPFLWEYVQPWVNHGNMALNQDYLNQYLGFVKQANAAGLTVLVDNHNYGRYYDVDVTTNSALQAAFANVWSQMATATKGMNVYYDLMNEPHDLSNNNTWVDTLNGAITAIRATGATNTIFVEGLEFASTGAWENSTAPYYVNIKDSGNNLVFEGHAYFDAALSGDANDCGNTLKQSVTSEIQPFITFLQQQNAKGFLGEFNMANKNSNGTDCNASLTELMTLLQQTPNIVGWTWWASGGFWSSGTTYFALDAADSNTQVTRLSPFLPTTGR